MQRVEPAARLIDRLADVVGGESAFQQVGVLERVMELRVGHGPRIEPAVDHLRDAPVLPTVVRVREDDLIDRGPVEVDIGQAPATKRLEFRYRADAQVIAVAIGPDGQRRAPEAFARERPIDVVLKPVAEASVADRFRHPVDGLVQLRHAVPEPAGLDEPRVLRVVDQRVAGAPPVRIVVQKTFGAVHEAAFFEQRDEDRIGVLEELPRHGFHRRHETAIETDAMHDGQAVLPTQLEVVLAIRRRAVHDAGTFLDGDEVGRPNLTDRAVGRQVVEQSRVADPRQVGALDPLLDRVFGAAQRGLDQGLGKDQGLVPDARVDVVDIGVRRERQVRRECPWRGRPDEEGCAMFVLDWKAYVDRGIVDFPVAEGDFVRRQRGAYVRVVGDHLVASVNETLVPYLPEQPPNGLYVGVVESVVGIGHVHPKTHALGHPLPIVDIELYRLAAPARELRHADLAFDLALVEYPEFLLDFVLDRQAVGVPTGLARAVISPHVFEARKDVLERAREDMVDAGLAVGGRRPLVPDIQRPTLALPLRRVEHVMLMPQIEHFAFELRAVIAARHVLESHRSSFSEQKPKRPDNGCCESSRIRQASILGAKIRPTCAAQRRGTTRFRTRLATRALSGHSTDRRDDPARLRGPAGRAY